MKTSLVVSLIGALLAWPPPGARAQDVEQVFRQVSPSVVVIRAKGREVTAARGIGTFSETGSGVLISMDGKIMTAAHVVHAMDEINVEFVGGERGPGRGVG